MGRSEVLAMALHIICGMRCLLHHRPRGFPVGNHKWRVDRSVRFERSGVLGCGRRGVRRIRGLPGSLRRFNGIADIIFNRGVGEVGRKRGTRSNSRVVLFWNCGRIPPVHRLPQGCFGNIRADVGLFDGGNRFLLPYKPGPLSDSGCGKPCKGCNFPISLPSMVICGRDPSRQCGSQGVAATLCMCLTGHSASQCVGNARRDRAGLGCQPGDLGPGHLHKHSLQGLAWERVS
mmetsp:Transcript_96576/g.201815  ORF Transcript_96576/g.201815 Transcript_96576/m.201815 type:complete len:232 (+) Transcript_96576:394-1089(+)